MSVRTLSIRGFSPQQQAFPFIPEDVRQQMTACWEQHFARAQAQALKKIETDRRKVELRVVNGQSNDFDWREHKDLLDLPLWRYQVSEYDVQPAPELAGEIEIAVLTSSDQPFTYSDKAIAHLHEKVLEYSLSILNSKGNAQEKAEILRWIWVPDIYCWVTKEIEGVRRRIPIYQGYLPFTFASCCSYYGVDAERMREELVQVLRPVLKALGMNSIIN